MQDDRSDTSYPLEIEPWERHWFERPWRGEMVFDAHDRAFAFLRGTCARGIYDNMKTAVEAVFAGKDRLLSEQT